MAEVAVYCPLCGEHLDEGWARRKTHQDIKTFTLHTWDSMTDSWLIDPRSLPDDSPKLSQEVARQCLLLHLDYDQETLLRFLDGVRSRAVKAGVSFLVKVQMQ